jgi:hypothetical protein
MFITHHAQGRYIVNDLRGKELVMRHMTNPDPDVQKQVGGLEGSEEGERGRVGKAESKRAEVGSFPLSISFHRSFKQPLPS